MFFQIFQQVVVVCIQLHNQLILVFSVYKLNHQAVIHSINWCLQDFTVLSHTLYGFNVSSKHGNVPVCMCSRHSLQQAVILWASCFRVYSWDPRRPRGTGSTGCQPNTWTPSRTLFQESGSISDQCLCCPPLIHIPFLTELNCA